MNPALILMWAEVGAKLVTTLGVPIAEVIKLLRSAGATDEQCLELIQKWAMLHATVADRIAFLKAAIAAMVPA